MSDMQVENLTSVPAIGPPNPSTMDYTISCDLELAGLGPIATNGPFSNHTPDAWRSLSSGTEHTLDISPHLLYHNPLGTIDYFSYVEQHPLSKVGYNSVRGGSVPVEQLMEEVLWTQRQIDDFHQEPRTPLLRQDTSGETLSDVQASTEAPYTLAEASSSTSQPTVSSSPRKRKRGRPRLYHTPADGSSDSIPDSRKTQLEKNRVAAEKCRRRRKESTTKLLVDVSVLSSRNEALRAEEETYREQLLSLKNEILRHAGCGSSIVDGYIAKTAGIQAIAGSAVKSTPARRDSARRSRPAHTESTTAHIVADGASMDFSTHSGESPPRVASGYDLFELLNDFVDSEEQ